MRGRTITLSMKKGSVGQAGYLYQYDYGQILIIDGVTLPSSYEVHFSNKERGNSKTRLGDSTGVEIPDEYLQSGENIHVWIVLHDTEDDGETEYHGIILVQKRAKPSDTPPTPVQQGVIEQAIAALNAGVEAIPEAIDTALAEAKSSGEFDGADGVSPTVTVSTIQGGHRLTITDAVQTQDVDVLDGTDGDPGTPGHTPELTSSKTGNVTTIFADGTELAEISDGADGFSGVYYGDTAPTDPNVIVWVDPDGEGTLIDDTSTSSNKVWSAQKVSGEISGVSSAITQRIPEPQTEGTNGQVLTTDGNGGRVWATPSGGGAVIDDTAGAGDTNKTWSADKLTDEFGDTVRYVLSRKFNVGDNLLTNETTFTGTGWSGSLSTGFTHATGNTDPIVFSASTVEDQAYIIDFDYSGDIGGDNMFVTIGDMPKVDVYHGSIRPFVGVVSDGGYLKIYCKSTYTGTITNLKIRPVLQSGGTEVTFECAEITNGQNPNEISSWHVVAIGRDVLSKNVNGTRTVAIGDRALEKIITGHRNIAIGPYAMPFVTEGDCNVSIGADTLYNPAMSTGESKAYSNVAIGKGTMLNGTLIQNNIAVGHGAMGNNATDSEENVCIGRQAGYNTGKNNTFIGHRAGYYYNGTGVDNVCIGHNAGFNAYHNGFNNVYIGAEARANVAGASASTPKTCNNSIAIGKGAYVTGSFQIVIGNANYSTVKIAGKTLSFNEDGTVTWS